MQPPHKNEGPRRESQPSTHLRRHLLNRHTIPGLVQREFYETRCAAGDLKNSGYFGLYGPVVRSRKNSCPGYSQRASLSTTAKFSQHFTTFGALPPSLVVPPPCTPHRCCQTDWTPDRDWLGSVFRAGSPGSFQKERPRGYYLPEPPLEGRSFVKSCFMLTHQKPDGESGVHNLSMAHGALTGSASSFSMHSIAGLEGSLCSSVQHLATPAWGWR
jgi:hypothetical protein